MSLKVKVFVITMVIAVLAVMALVCASLYRSTLAELIVSQETVLSSTTTGQTLLTFHSKLKSGLPVWTVSLKTLGTTTGPSLKVPMSKQSDGSFVGSLQLTPDQLRVPQTIAFSLYVNGIKTNNLSRVAITDTPVVLPPDPGEAGKETLSGIDSDNDGVRDDLEREIVFMYPQSQQIRSVLRGMVKKEQQLVTTTGDHEYFMGLELSSLAFYDCVDYLVFGNNTTPEITNINTLTVMVQNTAERLKYGELNYQKSLPFAGPSIMYGTATNNACTQPLVQGQY